MGSNMQRQAVALVQSEAPIRRHGKWNFHRGPCSRAAIIARKGRRPSSRLTPTPHLVSGPTEDLRRLEVGVTSNRLAKFFRRSNSEQLHHQRPIVKVGDVVTKSEHHRGGPSTDLGGTALGRNVLRRVHCRGMATTSKTRSLISERYREG